jgi:hypothetical protein
VAAELTYNCIFPSLLLLSVCIHPHSLKIVVTAHVHDVRLVSERLLVLRSAVGGAAAVQVRDGLYAHPRAVRVERKGIIEVVL